MGLITGVDSKGTFAPEKSLTRAEAATVLCRLVYADKRYTVCDPTYIGAPVGRTMPNMNNAEAKIIPLQ